MVTRAGLHGPNYTAAAAAAVAVVVRWWCCKKLAILTCRSVTANSNHTAVVAVISGVAITYNNTDSTRTRDNTSVGLLRLDTLNI